MTFILPLHSSPRPPRFPLLSPAIFPLSTLSQAPRALFAAAAVLLFTACQTPVVESRVLTGDRAFSQSRFDEAGEAWVEDDPAMEAGMLFRHAILCAKRRPACLPEDERALLAAIARDHSQSVFGVAVTRLFALEKRLGEAQSLEPLLDECLRTSMSIDDRRERAIAERDATQAALEEAEAKLTRLSRLAELQSFVQEVQRLQAELEAQKQENARLTEELDALKRIDLEN